MSLQEIVNVSITRETKAVSQVGFGTMLILGPNANFTSRTQEFTDADASLAAALCGGSDAAEYKAAQDALAQNPRVVKIKIGQIYGNKIITDDAGTWTAGGSISCKVDGVAVSQNFSTDKATTMAAFATKIALEPNINTAVYTGGSHIITITPDSGKNTVITDIVLTGITGTMVALVLSADATENIDDALDAIVIQDDAWYGLCTVSRTPQDQQDVAAWIETKKKIYVAASAVADIIDTTDAGDTTTIAALFKAAAYARSCVVYSALAATEYPDAALLGKILPYDPGTYTAKFKTLASITVDALTGTQSTNARDKHVNVNEEIGAVNIIREGTVSEGEFIDVIVFVDWLEARIMEGVYSVFVNNIKVPYTRNGMASIRGEIEKVLKIGALRGGISEYSQDSNKFQNGGYVVTLPAFEDIPAADKATRTLRGVTFTAWLAGAIHAVEINGIVTL